ncbi:NAD-dependent epimerase/dehydratase family protein [Microbacterium sp.]|uniref:NAD-dependent epimerase/dehydratase family protein n=1 Tax=Microbacterium sp. TaxID=51671 RepID=UPI0037366EEA
MPDHAAGDARSASARAVRVTGSAVVNGDLAEILSAPLPWGDLAGKTVLVTGAAGMIPAYAVYTLLALNDRHAAGITVLGLVRDVAKARRTFGAVADRPDFELIPGDVQQEIDLGRTVDMVIHGASPARPALHAASPVDTIRANVVGAFGLLDLCVRSGGAHFVLMSSAEVYGHRADDGSLVREDEYGSVDILNPRACYTEGKRAAETIAVSYHAQHGVSVTIARFGHIYGPGMALDDGRVQADFTADVLNGRDITLNSDGSARRTYTYLGDAIAGMFTAILQGEPTAYNISDRDGFISIRQLAETFTQARPEAGLKVRFREGVDVSAYNPVKGQGLSDERLRALGWAPRAGLAAGVSRTIAWHEERRA